MDIITGLDELKIVYSENQIQKLERMLDLLNEWNLRHNLTRYVKREDQIIYHILDSLSASSYFEKYESVLDIGTGAGFPGIPLAIFYPKKVFHLVDSNGKKIAYLRMLIDDLGLKNVSVHHDRIEKITTEVDVITARALASIEKIKTLTMHLNPKAYVLYVSKEESKEGKPVNVPGSNKTHFIVFKEAI